MDELKMHWKGFFYKMDTDHDGVISFDEFLQAALSPADHCDANLIAGNLRPEASILLLDRYSASGHFPRPCFDSPEDAAFASWEDWKHPILASPSWRVDPPLSATGVEDNPDDHRVKIVSLVWGEDYGDYGANADAKMSVYQCPDGRFTFF